MCVMYGWSEQNLKKFLENILIQMISKRFVEPSEQNERIEIPQYWRLYNRNPFKTRLVSIFNWVVFLLAPSIWPCHLLLDRIVFKGSGLGSSCFRSLNCYFVVLSLLYPPPGVICACVIPSYSSRRWRWSRSWPFRKSKVVRELTRKTTWRWQGAHSLRRARMSDYNQSVFSKVQPMDFSQSTDPKFHTVCLVC